MSYCDEVFRANCRDILENGFSDEHQRCALVGKMDACAYVEEVRHCQPLRFGREFPIMTLRRMYYKVRLTRSYGFGKKSRIA